MKFGLFILPSWPEESPDEQGRVLGEAVEQIQFAEELGFDSVWLAEHHFCRYGIVPNSVTMGMYIAAKTKRIRIATGVSVLTFMSAGPLKTLSGTAAGVGEMLRLYAGMAPLDRNITHEEVGRVGAFLLSDLSNGITGEVLHVDGGYNIMGSPGPLVDKMRAAQT